jgi:hypothetical protein
MSISGFSIHQLGAGQLVQWETGALICFCSFSKQKGAQNVLVSAWQTPPAVGVQNLCSYHFSFRI